MTNFVRLLFSVALFILLSASLVLGASVSIQPSGNGVFVIQGNNMDGVAGIQLDISYDATALATPTVTQGGLVAGAMFAANPGTVGSIKVAIISTKPFPANGQIALISFVSHTGTGSISGSTSLIDIAGKSVPGGPRFTASDFQTSTTGSNNLIQTPGIPFSQPNVTAPPNTPTSVISSAPVTTMLGSVSMPSDVQVQSQPKVADAVKPPDTQGEPAKINEPAVARPVEPPAEKKAVPETQKPEKVTTTSYKGILDNFREYNGEKTSAILIALFNKIITPTIRQEPAVVLSDGKSALKIVVEIPVVGDKSPNFALNGAKLVSLTRDASSTWIIETLPQAGVVRASLTILTDSDIIEYPLTLAPLLEGFKPTEADFALFLKDSGAATPKRDLNGDGKHDYLDDFIYTANFLVNKGDAVKGKN
jgi:hypothetical protein